MVGQESAGGQGAPPHVQSLRHAMDRAQAVLQVRGDLDWRWDLGLGFEARAWSERWDWSQDEIASLSSGLPAQPSA